MQSLADKRWMRPSEAVKEVCARRDARPSERLLAPLVQAEKHFEAVFSSPGLVAYNQRAGAKCALMAVMEGDGYLYAYRLEQGTDAPIKHDIRPSAALSRDAADGMVRRVGRGAGAGDESP